MVTKRGISPRRIRWASKFACWRRSPPAAINARAVDWTPPPRDRMTCEPVISAMAAESASLFGQKVDELGRPGGTLDGEDGGDAVPVEHDAVGLHGGCQHGIDVL